MSPLRPLNSLLAWRHLPSLGTWLRLVGVALLLLVMFPIAAQAQLTNIQYTTISDGNGGLVITHFYATGSGPLTIPSTINMGTVSNPDYLPVTSIGASVYFGTGAFENCTNVTSVTISSGITSIGTSAFDNCSLTSITIPSSVASIGEEAFENCTKLNSVMIANGVTSIAEYAFWNCTMLSSITIPNSVTDIGDAAFGYCTNLSSVTIGDHVATIEGSAFFNCTFLTSITLPSSVTSIGSGVFNACTNLASIAMTAPNSYYDCVDGVLFNGNLTNLIQYPEGKAGSYTVPGSVTSIGDSAFSNCTSLNSLTIDNGVTSIGDGAFSNCTSLNSVTIGNGITSIADSTFQGCTSLNSVTIGNNVTSIGVDTFYDCTALAGVTIPSSVTSIGDYAFGTCESLTSVVFIGNAPTMGLMVFDEVASGFTVYYRNGASGFTSPNWTDSNGDIYKAALLPPPPSITSANTVSGTYETVFGGYTIVATGSPTAFNATGLPTGLSINASTGLISGTPIETGTFNVSLSATNTITGTGTATLTLTINGVGFTGWEGIYSFSGSATDTPQNDGVPNLLKYVYDIDPSGSMSATDCGALPVGGMTTIGSAQCLTLTFREYAGITGVTVNVQTSPDMQNWTTLTQTTTSPPPATTYTLQPVSSDSNTGDPIMQVQAAATGTQQFIRLNVTSQ